MIAAEAERVKLYGLCSIHRVPMDARRTETARGVGLALVCASCDAGEPWPLEALASA